jgi:Protein of unknown function (DUF998)
VVQPVTRDDRRVRLTDGYARALGWVGVAGPVAFTVDWAVLGRVHDGYAPRTETISSLSAHDASGWGWMVAGQLCLAMSFVAVSVLLAYRLGLPGLVAAGWLTLAAYGTLQASAFRTICNHTDAAWCTPQPRSAHPDAQWLHGLGTGIAFGALQLAVVATAWAAWRAGSTWRDVLVVSAVAEGIALPLVVLFLRNAESTWHGVTEKVFLTTLAGWTVYCAVRLSRAGRGGGLGWP